MKALIQKINQTKKEKHKNQMKIIFVWCLNNWKSII